MKHPMEEHIIKDPVCGMEVSRKTALEEFIFKGKTYYFCADICRAAFEAGPDKYLHHHRQHGLKQE